MQSGGSFNQLLIKILSKTVSPAHIYRLLYVSQPAGAAGRVQVTADWGGWSGRWQREGAETRVPTQPTAGGAAQPAGQVVAGEGGVAARARHRGEGPGGEEGAVAEASGECLSKYVRPMNREHF